ncbi:MAG: IS110 family transposase [Eggerthellaceae bacterium]|nr:IS110 family transposase [Eggerthellaceae bacterium]
MDYDLLAYDVYAGFDVGRSAHHVVAIRAADQQCVMSRRVLQDEGDIRSALDGLARFGRILVAVDQKGSYGRLLVATAKSAGLDVGFLTPSDFHAFSKGYTEVKSDAKDACIIADVAMRLTGRLHPVDGLEESLEALRAMTVLRAALVRDSTQAKNRIRSLLVQTHPAFEAFLGKDALDSPFYLRMLERYGGPEGIRKAGKRGLGAFVSRQPYYKGKAAVLTGRIFDVLASQTVCLPGAGAREAAVSFLAAGLISRRQDIARLEKEIGASYRRFPESAVLDSLPGVADVLGPVLLAEIGDIGQYRDAGHLAAYAGVAPSKRQSGKVLDGSKKKVKCNRRLRNALCESARISVSCDEWSAWYYHKKRREGKEHKQAVLALARHRTDIIYAMLKNGSLYEPKAMTH